ncbi:MAG: hypothetical protein JWM41_1944 [Gemmatimonadetes bacterium]|nr:hypothetical protein [Gemmatimonadota bacterium]
MQRIRVLGFGALVVAGACATMPQGTTGSSRYDAASPRSPSRAQSRTLSATERDSVIAQMLADREGPGLSIRADFTSFAGSRRVRGNFHLDDDAYVLIGQIDADGVLRIVFPASPGDDGFVKGDKSYQTGEFFAGFTDQYRYRAQNQLLYRGADVARDSYDGGLGVLFAIASWRPMRFDRFTNDGRWDSFELADQDFLRDPRPAVHELASLLAGDNREAYTVKFARYYSTMSTAGTYSSQNAYGYGYCLGAAPFGFAASPFALGLGYGSASYYDSFYRFGHDFTSRGTNYYYDAGGDCYRQGGAFSGFGSTFGGYRIAEGPGLPQGRPHAFDAINRRPPSVPAPVPTLRMPTPGTNSDASAETARPKRGNFSPEYRQRGLITNDEASTGPVRRSPRLEAQFPANSPRSRPSIQETAGRHLENGNDGSMTSRARPTPRSEPAPRATPQAPPAAAVAPRSAPAPTPSAPTKASHHEARH